MWKVSTNLLGNKSTVFTYKSNSLGQAKLWSSPGWQLWPGRVFLKAKASGQAKARVFRPSLAGTPLSSRAVVFRQVDFQRCVIFRLEIYRHLQVRWIYFYNQQIVVRRCWSTSSLCHTSPEVTRSRKTSAATSPIYWFSLVIVIPSMSGWDRCLIPFVSTFFQVVSHHATYQETCEKVSRCHIESVERLT